ncbi:endonuclease III [Corynebacterium sp. 13CS0277]|uniref:endonuclease III n=1 Tax=Corynebacterium sp. 13CS0277 TaxID=2071994 RepID=UPI000D03E0D0|nr:endonuclease III [Corynebacterium sp. 13CS0277]PRQ12155.1 endonuclease III [Corynebacterium sp. 13CS0277]
MTRTEAVLATLAELYPDATCALHFRSAWELLVATVLSAQTTDVRVNQVTPGLFARYPLPEDLATADVDDVAADIRPLGMQNAKARNLVALAGSVVDTFGGEVPATMEDLVRLAGVGRKTASVVLGTYFHIPALPVDTHVQRVTRRLGLATASGAVAIEKQLCARIPRVQWVDFSHRVILHGRQVCHARRPDCGACGLASLCPAYTGAGE